MDPKNSIFVLIMLCSCAVWRSNCTTHNQDLTTSLLTDVYETAPDENFYTPFTTLSPLEQVLNEEVPQTKKFREMVQEAVADMSKKLFRAAYAEFDPLNLNVSNICLRHVIKTITAIRKMKFWALKMVDASGSLPHGFFSGTLVSFGDYDGCLRVNASGEFRGRYCLVNFVPPPEILKSFVLKAFIRDVSGKDKVLELALNNSYETKARMLKGNFMLALRIAICVPSTCSQGDVNVFVKKLAAIAETDWNVTAQDCKSVVDEIPFTTTEIASIAAFSFIFIMVAIGTLYDFVLGILRKNYAYRQQLALPGRFALCFSAISNTKKLLKPDPPGVAIPAFHGMKVVATCYVILIHTYSTFFMGFSSASLLNGREWVKHVPFQFIVNGNQAIEAFFFMTAVLLVFNTRVPGSGGGGPKKLRKRDIFWVQALRRYWRLMPSVMYLFAFSTILPHLGEGPEYEKVVEFFLSKCEKTWWTTLIFINNYIDIMDICMPWLWYIPVDMHLYLIGAFLLILVRKFPRSAYWIFGVFFCVACLVVMGNTLYFKTSTTPIFLVLVPPEDVMAFLNNYFMRSHLHMVPYATGMAVGYYLRSKPKLRIHWFLNMLMSLACTVMTMTVMLGVYEWNQGNLPTVLTSAFYNAGLRIVLSLSLAYLTIVCCTGNGGFATPLLSWAPFVPLGRLTFMAYLVHPLIQMMYIATTKYIQNVEHRTLIFNYVSYIMISYAVAYLCALCFEYPFAQLDKLVFKPPGGRKNLKNGTAEEIKDSKDANGKLDYDLDKDGENGDVVLKNEKTEKIEMVA